ncbi:MAG TPA: hypothetical protein VMH81_33480 [Bryobacteraceae bacterium]|nr:hypothetical protein [Bryobacteraceae bacterium]
METRSGAASRVVLLLLAPLPLFGGAPDAWIPARWTGGPLEVEYRAKAGNLPPDRDLRETIAGWYDPATLDLLQGSPVNCLLVTWSAGAGDAVESRQWNLVRAYTAAAHRRGIAVLGMVYRGAEPDRFVPPALEIRLDGLVLEGGFTDAVRSAMPGGQASLPVIAISRDPAISRAALAPLAAVEGEWPGSRSLAEMGIRAGPSSQPWICSNIWLVRSFRFTDAWRPVWVGYPPAPAARPNYSRSVADAAVAGGRWIVTLDDGLRIRLRRHDATALAAWTRIGDFLRFAEEHAEWRSFVPYGKLGVITDTAAPDDLASEYLKLLTRRQVPYRLVERSRLGETPFREFRALLAAGLAHLTETERRLLLGFAENGGLVVAGSALGAVPPGQPLLERTLGKGRTILYRDPDPETVARDMPEVLSLEEAGVIAFNVPSVITYASREPGGSRILVQLLNYSDTPARNITIRVSGHYHTARLFTPDSPAAVLAVGPGEGQSEVAIPSLGLWGGVLLEGKTP